MGIYNNPNKLAAMKNYQPIAVVAPQKPGERYGWGKGVEKDGDAELCIWEPALGDEFGCIPLGNGLLSTKKLAEEAAIEIARSLKLALDKL